jgi:hypothetical protein
MADKRRCTKCGAVLSMYNYDDLCNLHKPKLDVPEQLLGLLEEVSDEDINDIADSFRETIEAERSAPRLL